MTARQPRNQQRTCPDCGYVTKTTTAAMADYALSKHSCAHQAELARRAEAVRLRRADEGTVRDCTHTRSRHVHGTRLAYIRDRCRCRPCRDANTAVESRTYRLKAYGQWQPLTDAAPVREHLKALSAAGIGWQRAARLAKVPESTVCSLLYGRNRGDGTRRPPTRRVRPEFAQRILALTVDLDHVGDAAIIDGTGTRRRLQALVACGWTLAVLAHELGMGKNNLGRIARHADTVQAGTARAVRDLYDRLWDQPPPQNTPTERTAYRRALARTQRLRWLKPLSWDDDTIDDPAAWANETSNDTVDEIVDVVVVDRLVRAYPDSIWRSVGATRAERIEAAEELLGLCRRLRDAQRRSGVPEQWADGPTRNEIERCLSLRSGRDFDRAKATDVAS